MLERNDKNLTIVERCYFALRIIAIVFIIICIAFMVYYSINPFHEVTEVIAGDDIEVIAGENTDVLYALSDNNITSAKFADGSSAVFYGSDAIPVSYTVDSSNEDIISRMEELGIDELYVLGYIDDFSKDYKFTFVLADDQVWTLQEYRDGSANEWNFDTTLDEDKVKANIDLFISTMQ